MSKPYASPKLFLLFSVLLLVILGGVYLFMAFAPSEYPPLIDDAFIYLRFVKNFAEGNGIVWNRGGAPVEGFTSLLYFGLLVLIEKLGGSPLEAMPLLGIASTFVILGLSWKLGEYLNPGQHGETLLAILLMGLSPVFLYWSVAGFDISLFTVFLLASALSYLGYRRGHVPA